MQLRENLIADTAESEEGSHLFALGLPSSH